MPHAVPKITIAPPPHVDDVELSGPARQLWESVQSRWELDVVTERLLRCACESLMVANAASEQCRREGLTIETRTGVVKHPAALLERDHRAALANCLAKLHAALE